MGKQIVGLTEVRQLPPVIQLADNEAQYKLVPSPVLVLNAALSFTSRLSTHSYLLSVPQAWLNVYLISHFPSED